MLTKMEIEPGQQIDQQPTKVLVADDDLPTRMLLRAAMNQWGYDVIEAGDGEEAWEILHKESPPPMLLVVDWLMPKLDGIELTKRIKENLNFHPYIILLTQVTGTPNIVKALEAGADEFLTKPFNMAELRSRLSVGAKILGYKNIMAKQTQQLKQLAIKSESYGADTEKNKEFFDLIGNLINAASDLSSDVNDILPDISNMSQEKGGLYIAHVQKIQGSLDHLKVVINKIEKLNARMKK